LAKAFGHKYGQIIGNMLEDVIEPELSEFAKKHNLYLDKKGYRKARIGKKVAWKDVYGNIHDLDFVIERGGSDDIIGYPIAFVETAWRRYTKHSRNKAQEIQSAIKVLSETYKSNPPFLGVILAGEFTDDAIIQLKSHGFNIVFFDYKSIIDAFKKVKIDAKYDEDTLEEEFEKKINLLEKLDRKSKQKIAKHLINKFKKEIDEFKELIEKKVNQCIDRIIIIPLHGSKVEYSNIEEAKSFISTYILDTVKSDVYKYEIQIRYNNGGKITAEFFDKISAIDFLSKV
jgi:hypothetical protein